MDLRKLTDRAKKLVDERGGTESLKHDLAELREIATGKGSISEKAKAAAKAVREPGAAGTPASDEQPPAADAEAPETADPATATSAAEAPAAADAAVRGEGETPASDASTDAPKEPGTPS